MLGTSTQENGRGILSAGKRGALLEKAGGALLSGWPPSLKGLLRVGGGCQQQRDDEGRAGAPEQAGAGSAWWRDRSAFDQAGF